MSEVKKPKGYRFIEKIENVYIFCKPKTAGYAWKVVGVPNSEGTRQKYDIKSEESYETTLESIRLQARKGNY